MLAATREALDAARQERDAAQEQTAAAQQQVATASAAAARAQETNVAHLSAMPAVAIPPSVQWSSAPPLPTPTDRAAEAAAAIAAAGLGSASPAEPQASEVLPVLKNLEAALQATWATEAQLESAQLRCKQQQLLLREACAEAQDILQSACAAIPAPARPPSLARTWSA